jgi:hypothetical protein
MTNSLETATHAASRVLSYPLRWQFSVREYDAAFVFILRDLFV